MGSAALGAAAVLGAVASFGSFGVPIKSRRLQETQVRCMILVLRNLCETACLSPKASGRPSTSAAHRICRCVCSLSTPEASNPAGYRISDLRARILTRINFLPCNACRCTR